MAALEEKPLQEVCSGQASATAIARAQLAAVAWVRWRFFLNAFRRKGGKSEFVAGLLLSCFYALIAVGPVLGSGFAAFFLVRRHHADGLSMLFWAIFAAWTFFMASTAVAPMTIDLALMRRFPMRLRTYMVTRFFFGLLAPPNVVGVLALAAAAIGIGVARPGAFAWAAMVLFWYAVLMVLILRVCLLWLDRWLAERRTREIVGVFFALVFVSFQWVNVEFQSRLRTGHGSAALQRLAALQPVLRRLHPFVAVLPPSLAGHSIASIMSGRPVPALLDFLGILVFTAAVLALFAYRLRAEFRGEDFSHTPARSEAPAAVGTSGARPVPASPAYRSPVARIFKLPPGLAASIGKEVRLILRGPSIVMTVAMPLVLVGLYANRMGGTKFVLPLALSYTLLAMLPLVYNSLGADGEGIQLYLLSPTPLRHVMLAKNLVHCVLIAVVASIASGMVLWSHRPSAELLVTTAFWFSGVLFANLSLGNSRSLYAPVKFDMGKIQRKQSGSQLSMLVMIAVLAVWLGTGFAAIWVESRWGYVWIAPWIMLLLAGGAFAVYLRTLNRIGRVMLERRDTLIEVLCKA